nr:hypothetical protein [Anaerolineae bacterium]
MKPRRLTYANLTPQELKKVKHLEESLGTFVLVLEPKADLANLTDDQLSRIQALEEELGVWLLAYQGRGE